MENITTSVQCHTEDEILAMAKRLERALNPQWSDEDFEIWWNYDSLFTRKVNTWGYFQGTEKERKIWMVKKALGYEV